MPGSEHRNKEAVASLAHRCVNPTAIVPNVARQREAVALHQSAIKHTLNLVVHNGWLNRLGLAKGRRLSDKGNRGQLEGLYPSLPPSKYGAAWFCRPS